MVPISLPLSLTLMATLGTFMLFFGIYHLVGARQAVNERLGEYLGPVRREDTETSTALSRRKEAGPSSFSASVALDLARANLKLTVSEYMMLHLIAAILCFLAGFAVSHQVAGGLPFAIFGLFVPRMYVGRLQSKRLTAFNNQLADNMVLISNSLRSGYSLLQSFEVVSREAPVPTSEEFLRVVREVSLGLSPEEALANLVRRLDSEDLGLIVTAINVQHEAGGNLARILDSISGTIRQRVRVKGEIRVLTSQQRLTGYIVALLPVGVGLILYVFNPTYIMQLFSFKQVICFPVIALPVFAAVLIVVGFFVMQQMTKIEV